MDEVELSVIIPGFNTPEKLWRRCVESVRCEAPNAEIICVDDGSADGARFLDEMEGVTVVHQENAGPSAARNRGLEEAHGKWISFVDSDDEVLAGVYGKSLAAGESAGADVVVFGMRVVWPEDGLSREDIPDGGCWDELRPETVKMLVERRLMNSACNRLYRRKFLTENGVRFPLKAFTGEDLIFNFECAERGAKWCGVAMAGYQYNHTHSSSLAGYMRTLREGLEQYSDVWRRYKARFSDGRDVLGGFGEHSDFDITRKEWRNIWRPRSPYGLCGRWRWLKAHPEIGGCVEFARMAVFMFLRRHCYFKFIRRRHIKKVGGERVRKCTM